MLVGIYGDCHLTKNMRTLQDMWEVTATKSLHMMYNQFDEMGVEMAVCLGDFFDAPRLEAKHLNFILPILREINEKTYPTYILLGNHEADDEDSNILEYLRSYDNIIPVTTPTEIEGMLFLPYYTDPTGFDMKDKIVFTHHDIYGSLLASGKTKAFFGIDPKIFKDARLVLNGHVHLKSIVSKNIINSGSFLVSQQGELVVGEYPEYHTLNTKDLDLYSIYNKHSMIYQTIDESDVSKVIEAGYDQSQLVLKVEYSGEIPDTFINTAHTSWKKKISSIEGENTEVIHASNFDLKNYLVDYIKRDQEVSEELKENYIETGVGLL